MKLIRVASIYCEIWVTLGVQEFTIHCKLFGSNSGNYILKLWYQKYFQALSNVPWDKTTIDWELLSAETCVIMENYSSCNFMQEII